MESLNEMAKHDYPQAWPSLIDDITNYLSQSSEKAVHTGLIALKSLVKKYRLKTEISNKEELFRVFEQVEGFLVALLGHLVSNNSELSSHMLYLVSKIFYHANLMTLCPCLKDKQKLTNWMNFFL